MSRLRVRIELNQRMAGVPLDKMASVVEETHKFFSLLSEDVHIQAHRGEWLASDFDTESLNFTAEYAGAVSEEQAHAFGAAFAGATSLRRDTIAQFTRIAEFLGEDELVGFGLYQSDQETEPTEWRCLSKRDAMRFGEEIQLLAEAAGGQLRETQLPAVMSGTIAGRRLFKNRRERGAVGADPSKSMRELEINLSHRMTVLEGEVAEQTRKVQQISGNPEAAEERFQKLLSAMEKFWAQAPRQSPPLLAPEAPAAPAEALGPRARVASQEPRGWSVLGVSIAATAAILFGLAFPEIQQQWVRFASVEILPLVKPKPPDAPMLPVTPAAGKTTVGPTVQPAIQSIAARLPELFIGPSIPLETPANMKSKILSEVRVKVVVAIDEAGTVTSARIASTQGESAQLLVTEALRAALQSRFRPAREAGRTVQSQMVLTFLFKPESSDPNASSSRSSN
jgi:hypothetical protein